MPNQWSLKQLGEDIQKTLEADKDFPIGISGFPGSGKSTLAFNLAKNINENFDIQKQMIFTRDDLLNAINTLPNKSCIIVDEAVAILFRRDFMNTKQKELLKIMDIIRYKQFCIIFCVPNFWSLDSHLLTRIRVRLHIEKRGLAFIFERSNNPFLDDCWNKKNNEKLCWNWDVHPDAHRAKGFNGIVHFSDMPDYAKKAYLPLKDMKKILRDQEEADKPKEYKREIIWMKRFYLADKKLMDLGYDGQQRAKVYGILPQHLSNILHDKRLTE